MRALVLLLLAACASDSLARSPSEQVDSKPAVVALQAARFDEARGRADTILAIDKRNARAAAVRAVTTYRIAAEAMGGELMSARRLAPFDHDAWKKFLGALEQVDRDLAIAATDPDFSLELCLACWEYDWNHNGQIDDRDRKFLELEYDGKDGELADGDPRRRPTYRFDAGDIEWARAMVAFQRAAGELVLAYDWSALERFWGSKKLVFKLLDKERVHRARELVLAGLDHSERERAAYLAETDDDREWVPSPKQKSFAMPLVVDAQLYETWRLVLGDVRRMLRSEQGVSIRELQGLLDPGTHDRLPDAYLDLGAMFREPKDIVLEDIDDLDQLMRGVFGNGYKAQMKATPLLSRLAKMKSDLSRGEDTFERKLRYLVWLN